MHLTLLSAMYAYSTVYMYIVLYLIEYTSTIA